MIGIKEALEIILDRVPVMPTETIPLSNANGRYVADPVFARHEHPIFDMSAMDGYAFAMDGSSSWAVVGEVAAGEVFPRAIRSGEAVRIFTGAALPEGADTVVMQELVQRSEGRFTHSDTGLRKGGNVRVRGEHIKKGYCLAEEGDLLCPPLIGILATVGERSIKVHRRPSVQLLITGNEFAQGIEPGPGRIFSSNDVMLLSVLAREGIPVSSAHVRDNTEELTSRIRAGVAEHDVLITTGGASVGEHDLVARVLQELGAEIHFHGVAQKPGKPMLFAELNGKPILGLPGNPRAVLVLAYMYGLPMLRRMQHSGHPGLISGSLPLGDSFKMHGPRHELRSALVRDGAVFLLEAEGSHMLTSMVPANALVEVPKGERAWNAGDPIRVHYLPQ
ncbi:MAG: molybdopterin molybdotransferase MoeA [Flavobacteriales bacterium]|nr:molybdopterin molybdotransferase MoeA [Flavobacteriales bacterium]